MRNALILLAVIALVILLAGAINHSVAFDVDFMVGGVDGVSLFWVGAVVAAVAFAGGVVAMWLTHTAGAGTRRKLETELRQTYERLRAAEAQVAAHDEAADKVVQISPSALETTAAAAPAQEAVTTVAEEPTAVAGAPAEDEAMTAVEDEAETVVAGAAASAAVGAAAGDAASGEAGQPIGEAEKPAGADPEQTAVTVVGESRPDTAGAEAAGDERS